METAAAAAGLIGVLDMGASAIRLVVVEIDSKRTIIEAVVNGDRKILYRPQRKITGGTVTAPEIQIVIERHDIDTKSDQALVVDDATDVSSHVCKLVTSMFQTLTD